MLGLLMPPGFVPLGTVTMSHCWRMMSALAPSYWVNQLSEGLVPPVRSVHVMVLPIASLHALVLGGGAPVARLKTGSVFQVIEACRSFGSTDSWNRRSR